MNKNIDMSILGVFYRFMLFLFSVVVIEGCNSSSTEMASSLQSDSLHFENKIKAFPSSVDVWSYEAWLKSQHGIFYDSIEDNRFLISLKYSPIEYEAALSSYLENEKFVNIPHYVESKKGFQYFKLDFLSKKGYDGGNNPPKEGLARELKQALYFVSNKNDTITEYTMEFFPASVMDQPNSMVILFPDKLMKGSIKAIFSGELFQVRDLVINISPQALKKLPVIKV
ncbi:MAG: hypothetical protein K2Q22_08060, partial [Cytophagales bacterium]|nr:hypothetical protein [Cytophagales bacterium]